MKLTQRQKALLFEAYRRNEMCMDTHIPQKPLTQRWLGLGTEAAYRPAIQAGLMQFYDGQIPPPRCMGWLCLTEKWAEILLEYQEYFRSVLDDWDKSGKLTSLSTYNLAGGKTR